MQSLTSSPNTQRHLHQVREHCHSAVHTEQGLTLAAFQQRTCPSLSQHPASTGPSASAIEKPCLCQLADVPLASARERWQRGHSLYDKTTVSPDVEQHMRGGQI